MFAIARIAPDCIALTPRVALDADGAKALRPVMEAILAAGDATTHRVVLDLSRVDALDGSGVGAIGFLRKRLLAAGHRLELAGVRGQPLALLRQLGLARTLGLPERRQPFWAGLLRPLPGMAWGARA